MGNLFAAVPDRVWAGRAAGLRALREEIRAVKKKPQASVPRKSAGTAKAATRAKPAAAKRKVATKPAAPKQAASKRAVAAPAAGAGQSVESDLIVGPYGDLMSKQELALILATRTRVS
jgi:hypothetical protein